MKFELGVVLLVKTAIDVYKAYKLAGVERAKPRSRF